MEKANSVVTGRELNRIHSFPPIADQKSRVLILGSMPGVESLRKQQYYAHARNHFWQIIYALFGLKPEESYEKRVSFLLEKGIALWDVIAACYREGSSDARIIEEKVNDFPSFLAAYPRLRCICFNGGKAFATYRKEVGLAAGYIYERLTSTSPANTRPFADKLQNWLTVKKHLDN